MNYCFNCRTKKELISLRAKVNNFESGHTFSKLSDENLRLKKQLNVEKNKTTKLSAEVTELKKRIMDRDNIIRSKDCQMRFTNEELEKCKTAAHDLVEAKHKTEELEAQVQKLKAQVNMDFTSSSIPSSKCIGRPKITNNREKTDRKRGGQPGHKGNSRKQLPTNTPPVYLPTPDEVIENPDDFIKVDEKHRKSVDLHICVSVTDYISEVYQNLYFRSVSKPEHRRKSIS